MKKAFTLIELLVVIAIIAILAAILFPVFAQAKAAAKKTVDLSNVKQNITATMIYANDADDSIPITCEYESYMFAARLLPYTKNRDIFRIPSVSGKQGTIQRRQHDGGTDYMLPPDDKCVGLGTSTVGTAQYYNDIYPAMDYDINKYIFGYAGPPASNPCPGGKYGYFEPAPNTSSGSPGGDGQTGIGPGYGQVQFTSPAKVVLFIDFPNNGLVYPGGRNIPYWGSNFRGYWQNGSNVNHMDGHAKYYPMSRLVPGVTNSGTLEYNSCNNEDGQTPPNNAWAGNTNPCNGKSFAWWGTQFASADNQ